MAATTPPTTDPGSNAGGAPIELRSDNAVGVAPEIMAAVAEADRGSALAYGGDEWTARLTGLVRAVFEHPTATVFPVPSGTAANAIALSAMTPPWGAVVCHRSAHIIANEAGATSMFSGGAMLQGIDGPRATIDNGALAQHLAATGWGDPHRSQPAVLSLTLPTDLGTLYRPGEVAALAATARKWDLRTHLDGARLANAIAALGCSPAELTWRSGVDVVSLGAIKNGGMSSDAIVCFDDDLAESISFRLKRAGLVSSKMRFQSAQLIAYLSDNLWLSNAARANDAMARLARGLTAAGLELIERPEVNMAFVAADDELAAALAGRGLLLYRTESGVVRFVTSFRTSEAEVAEILRRIASLG